MLSKTIHALCRTIAFKWKNDSAALNDSLLNELADYVLQHHRRLPFYYRLPIAFLSAGYALQGLIYQGWMSFHLSYNLSSTSQQKQLSAWQNSRFTPAKQLVFYIQSLVLVKLFSPSTSADPGPPPAQAKPFNFDDYLLKTDDPHPAAQIAVIGSGPGGALTAALLAEAGFEVVLIEEGDSITQQAPPYSAQEFSSQLRYGGAGVMLGRHPIAYLEGRCLGGGSEINSGLYLRPMPATLQSWQERYRVSQIGYQDLRPFFEKNEQDLNVSSFIGVHPAAGMRLAEGAKIMGWQAIEVDKWRSYQANEPWQDDSRAPYRSMSRSFLPRFCRADGRLLLNHRVQSLTADTNQQWRVNTIDSNNNSKKAITAQHVFVCAGAVQTAALLRRSVINKSANARNIKKRIGNNLNTSLIIKAIGRFTEPVNNDVMGMPVQQVREFAPGLTLGCAISSKAQLALGLQYYPDISVDLDKESPYLAVYSVMLSGSSVGQVRNILGRASVRYDINPQDWLALGDGLKKLCSLLLASGASAIYPIMKYPHPITSAADIDQIPTNISVYKPPISSLHLAGSCPMGENRALCATNSFGQLFDHDNLYVNDASLLCDYPGANPQATLMAVTRRNVEYFIQHHLQNKP